MRTEKKKARRTIIHCEGCNKDILRPEYDKHILEIIRSLRV